MVPSAAVGDGGDKEKDARIRALTREVGSVREDLRRETKRRERAVVQAKESEQACAEAEKKVQELGYANRKLAAELDAAHDAARTAAERDKRMLRSLRERMAQVEKQVAERATKGSALVSTLLERINALRSLLLTSPGVDALGPSMANQATNGFAHLIQALSQLSSLLAGPASDEEAAAQEALGQAVGQAAAAAAEVAVLAGAALDIEKEQLRDEVSRLRSQLRALVDKAAGAAGAASMELQALLRDSQAEAASLRTEVAQLHAALQRSSQDSSMLRHELDQVQSRLWQQEASSSQTSSTIAQLTAANKNMEQQAQALHQQNTELSAALHALREEHAVLKAQLSDRDRQLLEQSSKMAALQASVSAQQADMRAAMELVSGAAAVPRSLGWAGGARPAGPSAGGAAALAARPGPLPGPVLGLPQVPALGSALGSAGLGRGLGVGTIPAAPVVPPRPLAAAPAAPLQGLEISLGGGLGGAGPQGGISWQLPAPGAAVGSGDVRGAFGASHALHAPAVAAPPLQPHQVAAAAAAKHLLGSNIRDEPPAVNAPHLAPGPGLLFHRPGLGQGPAQGGGLPTNITAPQGPAGPLWPRSASAEAAQGQGARGRPHTASSIAPSQPTYTQDLLSEPGTSLFQDIRAADEARAGSGGGAAPPGPSQKAAVAAAAAAAIAARLKAQQAAAAAASGRSGNNARTTTSPSLVPSVSGLTSGIDDTEVSTGSSISRSTSPAKAAAMAALGAKVRNSLGTLGLSHFGTSDITPRRAGDQLNKDIISLDLEIAQLEAALSAAAAAGQPA